MRIVFLGPPGSGKGTQAQILAQKMDIPQISTGDVLREAAASQTAVGKKAKKYMDKGELVPDSIVIDVVREKISHITQFILDGFPRTLEQAQRLDQILYENSQPLHAVINITVPLSKLIERLSGRLICKSCNAIYHKVYNPPSKKGVCDKCQGELYQRSDDTEEAITRRFQEYKKQTKPLIEYYQNKGILIDIDGTASIKEIADTIEKKINALNHEI